MKFENHYKWLDANFQTFMKNVYQEKYNDWIHSNGLISAHGDKCYSYRDIFEKAGIHFYHGVALYLLTYCSPYSKQVRETKNGWVKPEKWIVENYSNFKQYLPPVEE